MRTTLITIALVVLISVVAGFGGYSLVRPSHREWRDALAETQAQVRADRIAQAIVRERLAAARSAAEQAIAIAITDEGFNPLVPSVSLVPTAGAGPLNPDFGNLPDTEGVDVVYYACTACHSTALMTQQRLSRERWDYVLTWMVDSQNMNEPSPEDRETMLTYLTRHYGEQP